MTSVPRVVRPRAGPPARTWTTGVGQRRREAGMLSLEAVWMLPVLALLVLGLLETAGVLRDVLLTHEAARSGARTAATTSGAQPVHAAAREAAPELQLRVEVTPSVRSDGDLAVVVVRAERRIGPVTHTISARAVARVEPAVGTTALRADPP